MILIFEQDLRGPFEWMPELYLGKFDQKKTWRFTLGWWSLSCFASEGLKEFMEHIACKATAWKIGD